MNDFDSAQQGRNSSAALDNHYGAISRDIR